MDSLSFSFAQGFFPAAALAALSFLTWFLIRVKVKQLRFPILRVLDLPPDHLPKLRMDSPPWVPFFCFVAAVLALLFLHLKPTSPKQMESPLEGRHILVAVDLSSSVSSLVDIRQYRDRLNSFIQSVGARTRVSLAFSDRKNLVESDSPDLVKDEINRMEFHRFGTRLGLLVKNALTENDSFTDVVVFSDSDNFSWSDFNWRFLSNKLQITKVDLGEFGQTPNIFIKSVRYQSSPDSKIMEWLVELGSSRLGSSNRGVLSAKIADQELARQDFKFEGREASFVMTWPYSKLRTTDVDVITFQVENSDPLPSDNLFRINKSGVLGEALIVSDPGGELPLEDPSHSLINVFEILGLNVNRRDQASKGNRDTKEALIVNWIGSHGRDSCEVSSVENQTRYWVIPETQGDFLGTCRCLAKIASRPRYAKNQPQTLSDLNGPRTDGAGTLSPRYDASSEQGTKFPVKCSELTTRDSWIAALTDNGFSQIGGELGHGNEALAYRGDVGSSDVLVFQIPFSPLAGIPHGRWPMIVKAMLKIQNLGEGASTWPRSESFFLSAEEKHLAQSNVPIGESILEQGLADNFPPTWSLTSHASLASIQDPNEKDPLPWIKFAWFFVLAIVFLEIIYNLYRRLKLRAAAKALAILTVSWTVSFCFSHSLQASGLVLSVLGNHPSNMRNFSKQLADRTSISLSENVQVWPVISKKTLREPWLMVTELEKIQSPSGGMNIELESWVRKGGILVIEGDYPTYQLERLTSEGFRSTVKLGEWRPIAPDHEMMRSFYLLDSLPSCNGSGWSEFRYDGRTAILAIPFNLTSILAGAESLRTGRLKASTNPLRDNSSAAPGNNLGDDGGSTNANSVKDAVGSQSVPYGSSKVSLNCEMMKDEERLTRVLVNIFMVSLATDYKKDQIHLPEILKRLR